MKERTKFIYFTEALKTIDFLSYDINYNKELARWAFQIVLTRAIGDDNEQRIAPIADMVSVENVHDCATATIFRTFSDIDNAFCRQQ